MPKFRTLKSITYVDKGKVVSAEANRTVELTDRQAEKLADSVVRIEAQKSMFPEGQPVIEPHIVRNEVKTSEVPVTPEAPKPVFKPKGK